MKKVLVLDANQRSALAASRSLGRHRVPLITADECPAALAGSSRYSLKYYIYPSPQQEPAAFITAIAELCKQEAIKIIMPMTELTAALLLAERDNLPEITLPFAGIATVNSLADKCSLMRLAESLDIPVPKTWYAENAGELPVALDTLDYPLVLKPGKSWLEHGGKWLHTSVRIASSSAEAEDLLNSDPAFAADPFMLQEYLPGKGEGVFTLYNSGKSLAFFAHQRLREKPPRGGVSVLSESRMVDPELLSYSRKLLDHANWHGVAMVEFRVTPEGKPYLMEINTRFWGSLQLAIDAGVDFPWLLYQLSCGKTIDSDTSYQTGKRLRWFLGDLDSLYLTLRDDDYSAMEKLRSVINFLVPHPLITRHEVNRLGDINPFFQELKQYIKDLSS